MIKDVIMREIGRQGRVRLSFRKLSSEACLGSADVASGDPLPRPTISTGSGFHLVISRQNGLGL
jgi:hypothetical protein